jgi:protein-L-isoaspartate(D-aspartate) O-methyltransferase
VTGELTVEDFRDFYARFVVASAGSSSEPLIRAFATVRREDFVGPGPWQVFTGSGYLPTLSDEPALLYHDILIGLLPEKGINNGQPSLHARCLAAAAPGPGETVVHIGAGSGYYTAILANLVGPTGRVDAFEVEPTLVDRARAALKDLPNVEVHCASAAAVDLPAADVIYVNAGVTHIPAPWLDALNIGGRLVVPLTPQEGFGGMLLAAQVAPRVYAASILARVSFIPCSAPRLEGQSQSLAHAFEPHSFKAVRSLHRDAAPDESAWYVGEGWWLSTGDPRPS